MTTILLPCDGSENALLAVRHVIAEFQRGAGLHVHLLNVQPPFSAHIARHVSQELRADFHRERADEALAPARRLLGKAGVPYDVHTETGDRIDHIAGAARRLRCDRIVVGTARKSPLVRAVLNSLTGRLIERAQVPVEVITGAPAPLLERFGVPVAMGTGLALLWPVGP